MGITARLIYSNDIYELVIVDYPCAFPYPCYGVRNRQTGVNEAFVSQLHAAIQCADELQDALRHGGDRPTDAAAEAALISALTAVGRKGKTN